VKNRVEIYRLINALTATKPSSYWMEGLERLGVPVGPVNDIAQVFSDPHVLARGMKVTMPIRPRPRVRLISSATDQALGISGRLPSPAPDLRPAHRRGAEGALFMEEKEIAELRVKQVI